MTELDELDGRIASSAAQLLQTVLQSARLRADPEAAETIDALTECRLIVTAIGPTVQVELLAPSEAGTVRLFGITAEELDHATAH